MLATRPIRPHRPSSLYSIHNRLQEDDPVTTQPHLQIRQEHLHVGHVADFIVIALLLAFLVICHPGHHPQFPDLDRHQHPPRHVQNLLD